MRLRRALLLVAAIALAACSQAEPSPSPTVAVSQQHDCGNLSANDCDEAIAAVVRQVPAMAGSPVSVAATLDPDRPAQRGGDRVVLVAFAPFDETDLWFNPPTWIATQGMLSSDWRVEPWGGGSLPAHFVTLLKAAGIAAPSAAVSSPPPVSVSPLASVTPAPSSPSPTTVALLVSVQVLEQCGSEGGCAFHADLRNGEGQISSEKIDIGSDAPSSFPGRLPVGVYTLTFRSSLVSDVILNGAPPDETPDAACKTSFEVVSGQNLIFALGVFRADSCEIHVTAS